MELMKAGFTLVSVPFFLLVLSVTLVYISYRGSWLNLRLVGVISTLLIVGSAIWIGYISKFPPVTTISVALAIAFIEVATFIVGNLVFPQVSRKLEIPF